RVFCIPGSPQPIQTAPVFFQAEDGIRGFHVTGVQTCALPIYGRIAKGLCCYCRGAATFSRGGSQAHPQAAKFIRGFVLSSLTPRSEERRVGKSVVLGGRRDDKNNGEEGAGRKPGGDYRTTDRS